MATKLRLIDGSMPRLPETRKVNVRKDGDIFRSTEERYVAKIFLQNNCDIEDQLLLDQKIILDAIKNDYPEIYKEKYEGKTFDFIVNFIAPNPKYDPNKGDNYFHGYNLNCRCQNFYCRNSELLQQLIEKRFSLNEYWYHTKIYNGLKDENGDCRDDAARHIDKALEDIGKTPKEFFNYPLAGIPWGYEQQFLAPKKKEKKEEKQEAPQKELTREELLEQDRLFLAEQDRREEERVAKMRERQARVNKPNKSYQLDKKTIEEEPSNQEEQEEFDYSALSDDFIAQCTEEDEVYEYDIPEEYDLTAEYEDVIEEPEELVTEEAETTQITEQPRAILRAAYGGAYFNFNPDFVGYGDQSRFKETKQPAMPEQEPEATTEEETTASFEVVTEFEQVPHCDSNVNAENETTASFEIVTELEQVPHCDSNVNTEDETTASFEVVTEHQPFEKYVLVGDNAEVALFSGIEIDSPSATTTFEVITEFELESVEVPSITNDALTPEPVNQIKPFRRSSQNLHESYQVPRSMAYGHAKPAKIPLNPFILNNNSTKMALLEHEIPKIPIESASSRPKHPKIVPKPLKLSRKPSKSPPDRNPLDRHLYLKKDSLATRENIKQFKKEKYKSLVKRRRKLVEEKYFRIPMLC